MIAEYVPAPYMTLGTDGFGRSDTRQQLRRFFEVDRYGVVMAALYSLVRQGRLDEQVLEQARRGTKSLAGWPLGVDERQLGRGLCLKASPFRPRGALQLIAGFASSYGRC